MNDAELTPIRREAMSSYVMMSADLDTIPTTYDPKIGKIRPEQLHKPFNDASRALAGMATLLSVAGATNETAMKAAATFQLISAGVEITAGFQTLYEALTALKTAEAMAHLTKYGPLIPIFVAGAVAGAVAFSMIMESREYNFTGDYSGASGQRRLQAQIAQEGI